MALEINQYANIQKSAIKIKGTNIPNIVPIIPNYSGTTYSALTENDYFAIGGFITNDEWLLDKQMFVNTADKRCYVRTDKSITEFSTQNKTIYTGLTATTGYTIYSEIQNNHTITEFKIKANCINYSGSYLTTINVNWNPDGSILKWSNVGPMETNVNISVNFDIDVEKGINPFELNINVIINNEIWDVYLTKINY